MDSPTPTIGKPNWPVVLITGLVSLCVSVLAGMIIFLFQGREPHLVYTASDTLPFYGENSRVTGVYQISIANDGKRAVEDVVGVVRIPNGKVEQQRVFGEASLTHSETIASDSLRISLPTLNPSESVQISVLVTSATNLPNRPEISLRAKGITGSEKRKELPNQKFLAGLSVSTVAASVALFMPMLLFRLKTKTHFHGGLHSDDQRGILSFLLHLNGLHEEADRLIDLERETVYWAEADRLGFIATETDDPSLRAKIKSVLEMLTKYANVAELSEAIIFYNLARIALLEKDEVAARQYLKRGLKSHPGIVKLRATIDPSVKSSLD